MREIESKVVCFGLYFGLRDRLCRAVQHAGLRKADHRDGTLNWQNLHQIFRLRSAAEKLLRFPKHALPQRTIRTPVRGQISASVVSA